MTPTRRGFVAALAAIPALLVSKVAGQVPSKELPGGDSLAPSPFVTTSTEFRRLALKEFAHALGVAMNRASFMDTPTPQRNGVDGWRQYSRSCLSTHLTIELARTFAREMAADVIADGGTQFSNLELLEGVYSARIKNDRVAARMVVAYDIMLAAWPVRFDVLARKA